MSSKQSGASPATAKAGQDRLAIVTGAASGIGRATAHRLFVEGYHVIALDRDAAGIERLASECGPWIVPVQMDLSKLDSIEHAIGAVIAKHGVPDAVVNAAGIALVATVLDGDLAAWQRVIDINLTAPMLVCRAVIPAMIERGGGAIVNVASVASFRGVRNRAAYCSAKAGLVGLTKSLTADFAGRGIRVNSICPGTVETGYTQAVLAVSEDPEATRQFMTQRQLIGRMGTPEEIADAIAFLVGPASSFMYGSSIIIDGGRSVL
jgi:NAD(P)-dependent dehydrogenase (short-subunit alcohol dehydrogenase family)